MSTNEFLYASVAGAASNASWVADSLLAQLVAQLILNLLDECVGWQNGLPRIIALGVIGEVIGQSPGYRVKGRRRPRTIAGAYCSFSPETPVATAEGQAAIGELKPGAYVLAYDEATGELGFYPVTAVYSHTDPLLVHLTLDSEVIETTPEHPFSTAEGEWLAAAELQPGQRIRNAVGGYGLVEGLQFVARPEVMYNLTVAEAHTYFVGAGQWLVHNACPGWVKDDRTFVNWAKNLEKAYKKSGSIPSADDIDELVNRARQYGVYIRMDPPHPGTTWEIPHLNVGKKGVHVPLPPGYTLP